MFPAAIHILLSLLAAPSFGPVSKPLRELLDARPADSLVAPLRKFESEHAQAAEAGEAAYVLGELHFARGEYRQACDAFGRAAAHGQMSVQIGAFADPARAKTLVESARHAGFPDATVVERGDGDSRMHVVTLGVFGSREEARRAGERAAAALGVTYQVTKFP